MPLKPVKDQAIRTPRDAQRRADREALYEQWAKVDVDIRDALGDDEPPSALPSPP